MTFTEYFESKPENFIKIGNWYMVKDGRTQEQMEEHARELDEIFKK